MKILDVPQSGSVAGVTSSRNAYGQYRRTRAIPVNPASTFQGNVRARLSQNASDWRNLTATEREGWATLGAYIQRTDSLGQVYSLSGFQCFVSVNNNRLAAGDAVITTPPALAFPDPMVSITPTISSAAASIAYTPTPVGAAERVFINMSPMRSAGAGFNGDYRLILVTAAAAASPANVLAAYQGRFGTPITGTRIFVSIQRYAAGFLSQPINTSVVVA